MNAGVVVASFAVVCFAAGPAVAQAPPGPPPPAWTGSIGAGVAVTSGNSDTSNINGSFKAIDYFIAPTIGLGYTIVDHVQPAEG